MTEHNTKKILNLTAVATLTATAGVAVANNTAHADTVTSNAPQTQQQQTPQEQYQAAQKSADQKINDQANANKAKEDALAKQNEAANAADAQKTNDAVNKVQDQINKENADLKKQNDQAYSKKSQEVSNKVANDTKTENDQYNANVAKQTKENQQAEQAQEEANAKALADAAKNTTTPAQKQTLKDNAEAKKNADVKNAQAAKDKVIDDAKKNLEEAQANAQSAHDQAVANQKSTNQKRLDDAQKAYEEAIKNAPKTGAVTPAEPEAHADDDDTSNGNIYPNTDPNSHNGLITDYNSTTDKSTVNGLNEIDMSGKPGWIYYNSQTDNSEQIDIHNLTEHQKEILNEYTVNELNALRNWFANNISKEKHVTIINVPNGFTAISQNNINKLHVAKSTIKWNDDINNQRTIENDDDETHTKDTSLFFAHGNYWHGENLINNYTQPKTMLQALVEIHNAIQAWAYGELNASEYNGNTITLDFNNENQGHLANILSANFNQVGVIFDHNDAILLEFSGETPSDPDISTPEIAQILAAQSGQGTPDLNAPSVKQAAQHVEDVKAQNAKDLAKVENESLSDAGQDAYNNAVKSATDTYDAAIKNINAAYDAEIKRINALPESNDQLKASLDQKLADLKKSDAQKLADLKTVHENKLAQIKADGDKELADYKQQLQDKLNNNDPAKSQQIADLKAKHESFVQANAKKLADLQASDAAGLNALKTQLYAELNNLHEHLFPQDTKNTEHQNGKEVVNGNGSAMHFANGKTVVLPEGNVAAAHLNASTTNDNHQNGVKSSKKSLPQTGNKDNLAAIALGAMTALLGLRNVNFN